MPTYIVQRYSQIVQWAEVEAETEDDALEIAEQDEADLFFGTEYDYLSESTFGAYIKEE